MITKKRFKGILSLTLALSLAAGSATTLQAATPKFAVKKVVMVKGETRTLKVVGKKAKNWTSTKKSVATVSAKGKVPQPSNVKWQKKTLSCTVKVEQPVISKTSVELEAGKSQQLNVTGTTLKVKWSSSDSSVAKVSANGLVEAQNVDMESTVTIKATVSKKTYSCQVTVKPAQKPQATATATTATSQAVGTQNTLATPATTGKPVATGTPNANATTAPQKTSGPDVTNQPQATDVPKATDAPAVPVSDKVEWKVTEEKFMGAYSVTNEVTGKPETLQKELTRKYVSFNPWPTTNEQVEYVVKNCDDPYVVGALYIVALDNFEYKGLGKYDCEVYKMLDTLMRMRKMQKRFLGVLLAGTMAVGSVTAINPNVLVQTVEAATEQLSKPTNVHWDGMTATWDTVPNATGYEVALVGLEDEEEVAKKVVTSNSCDFFQDVAAKGVGYRVRVRALDDTGKYAGSDVVYCMPVMMLWLNTAGGNLEKDNDGVGFALYLTVPIGLQMNLSGDGPLLEGKKEGNIAHYYHDGKELFYVDEVTFDYTVLEGVTDADKLVLMIDNAKENESPGTGIGFYDGSQMQPGKEPVVSVTPDVSPTSTSESSAAPVVSAEPTPKSSVAPTASAEPTPGSSAAPTVSASPIPVSSETPGAHIHKKTANVTKATLSDDGKVEEICSECGEKISETIISKVSKITLEKSGYEYDGNAKNPNVVVKDSKGTALGKDTDYTVSYEEGRTNAGKYAVTITLQGNYSGTKTVYFTVNPEGTSLSSVKAGKKRFTVKWKKQAKQTTGYELQYGTDSKFKSAKTVIVSKNKTVSASVSKLKAKKKYYVRIRTYKTVKVNGKSPKIYSGWSKVKTVKTK